jgi:FixJ family two-component response regulator
MKAGALDFLMKPFDDQSLLDAIHAALEHDSMRFRNDTHASDLAGRYASLTNREKEVFALVTEGLMNKQAAGEMNLSEITVKVHRGTMMRKMRVRTLADLVRAAETLKNGMKRFTPTKMALVRSRPSEAAGIYV